jgi:hypothetical protein
MGSEGRKRFESHFRIEGYVEEFSRVYDELFGERKRI